MPRVATGAEQNLRVNIRRAGAGEAGALSLLALESKRHWGYRRGTSNGGARGSTYRTLAEPFYVACGAIRESAIAAPIADDPAAPRPQLVLRIGRTG
jgi:hypothetical protein